MFKQEMDVWFPLSAETMCPAVVHFAAVDGDMASSRRRCCGWSDSSREGWRGSIGSSGWRCGGVISAMKASVAGSEAPNALFVAELKLRFEESKGPFGRGTKPELFSGAGEKAFDHGECKGNHCDIRNRYVTECGDALNVCNFRPQAFYRIIKIPGGGQCGAIGFQFFGSESSVFTT